ncbi:MAG: 16S rRNA (guanine(966)-N(2))-methyltransferase RsmD [Rhodospirillales bacterium]|nr:16S rRNA (guanine(966)-N(2))-methyltransferase RsmD [Rhodospirillales bacterium]
MRIVGGKFRGRILNAPPGRHVRPTSDRAREGIFNVLAHSMDWDGFDGITIVDVFSGTGALGLEAMSRGAAHGVFIDNDAVSLKCVRENAAALGEARNITPLKLDATRLAPPPRTTNAPLGLAFMDAPYGSNLTDQALLGLCHKGWLAPGALVIVEIGKDMEVVLPREFQSIDERTYGAAKILFLQFK